MNFYYLSNAKIERPKDIVASGPFQSVSLMGNQGPAISRTACAVNAGMLPLALAA